ncbi:MAG: hypothetical protein ACFE0J_12655 [Elainellaceae cyanobacterium]
MRIKLFIISAIATTAAVFAPVAVKADTVDARCDVYPRGEDHASLVTPCTFSQRQGAVGIQFENGQRFDLAPVGDQPGNYVDQNGNAAYRQSGLGDRGLIFRLADESIYVYWDTAGLSHSTSSNASSGNPVTYTTFVDPNHIIIQIDDDYFFFHETLTKLPGPDYAGSDGHARVILTPDTGRIVIFDERTGETLYDYSINPVFFGEDPSTMCDPATEPC